MIDENWRDVEGYEDFLQVNCYGDVRSKDYISSHGQIINGKLKGQTCNNDGYKLISIKGKQLLVHRLVAKAFPEVCGEWKEHCVVHHKDHNPSNNCADNLLVMSFGEHSAYHNKSLVTRKKIGFTSSKTVYQYDKDWNFLYVYGSTIEASNAINGDTHALRNACCGKKGNRSHYYKGYRWLYA